MSGSEHPLVLVEIHHDNLPIPLRIVADSKDLVSQGETYIACPFDLTLPDETEANIPRATLSIANIGRPLSQWVERTIGGKDARVLLILVMRSDPNTHEWSIWTDLSNVNMSIESVSAQLTFEDIINKTAVPIIYNVEKACGLF
jgi:hypothetical protein